MIWLIEPQDPLLVRDGRPFGPTPGARARTLPFPFPSTTAGAVRTRAGEEDGQFKQTKIKAVEDISMRGPLLVEVADDGTLEFFAPAPGDALLFDRDDKQYDLCRLVPLARPTGAVTDLDGQLAHVVGLPRPNLNKPAKRPPVFWKWERFAEWLKKPADKTTGRADLGIDALPADRRMHVGIDPATLTGRDGALFMTGGLTFWRNEQRDEPKLSGARRLALAVSVDDTGPLWRDTGPLSLDPGFAPMGGERRLMHWQMSKAKLPDPPDGLREQVMTDGACRVVLLTPAYFAAGWRPAGLLQPPAGVGVTPELLAAVVGKPQTVSGWNLVTQEARESRRLAPAGSVYFLKLSDDKEANGKWFDETWMQCVSDNESDCRSGFGLAAVGVWSGVAESFEVEEAENAPSTN